jgi:hypothetical protein
MFDNSGDELPIRLNQQMILFDAGRRVHVLPPS